jgi:hypothetical protein
LFQLKIVSAPELYPKSPVGFREEEPKMALPNPHIQARRRQILDDQTGGTPYVNARECEGTWADGDSGDAWVKNFVGRLAALVRDIGGSN